MLKVFLLVACVELCLGDSVNMNEAIDQFLDGLRQKLQAEGKDTIPVDNMDGETTWKKGFIKFTGEVHCRNGWVGHLASIRRTGDVIMTTEDNKMTIKLSLGVGDLEARFDECQLKASKLFSITQSLEASSSPTAISAQISLIRNGNECISTLDHANLDEMGHLKLKTGSNVLHNLEDLVLNLFTRLFHGHIKDRVNDRIVDALRDAVNKNDLCDKLPM